MELKGRLKLISEMVGIADTVFDVGSDHAYIPIDLALRGKCRKAIAADVHHGPVVAAEKNVHKYKLEQKVEVRLGYGMDPLRSAEVDTVIIAGMGGVLITEILQKGMTFARQARQLILQPMNASELLRQFLYEQGFDILEEELVQEGEKIYVVIKASCAEKTMPVPSELELFIGPRLIEKRDPLLKKYLERKIRQQQKIANGLLKCERENIDAEPVLRLVKSMQELEEQL